MSEQFGLLYALPSALQGAASVLDIGGTLEEYNPSENEEQADFHAIRSDWRAVGDDIRAAAKQYVEQQKREFMSDW